MTDTVIKLCWETNANGKEVRCRDWNSCGGREWYEMRDIQYCRNQVLFLLQLIDYLPDGWQTVADWPKDPHQAETGYSDVLVQTSPSSHANYEAELVITAELIHRLERTGKDGRLLLFESRTRELTELSQDARNALNYVAGWKRKSLKYSFWLRQRNHRKGVM
jgi:hypothetical protein